MLEPPPEADDINAGARPNRATWVVHLFFRPKLFFVHWGFDAVPLLTAFCAWTYGVTGVIDRIEMRSLQGRGDFFESMSWGTYWIFLVGGGALSGALYYGIGGWWYRLRLKWCQAEVFDLMLARRVYIYSSQVVALPTLVAIGVKTSAYDSPAAMHAGGELWSLALVVFLFWSVWTSYVGVRTIFNPRPTVTRVWFLILPGLVYFLILLVGAAIGLAEQLGPPEVKHPETFQSQTMSFSYPSNWWINDSDEDHDPDRNLEVEPPQDAMLTILLYESDDDANTELAGSLDALKSVMKNWRDQVPWPQWGTQTGIGALAFADIDEQAYIVQVLIVSRGEGAYLEIRQITRQDQSNMLQPGYRLISTTFRLLN